jgi:hypothetical protein
VAHEMLAGAEESCRRAATVELSHCAVEGMLAVNGCSSAEGDTLRWP